MGIVSAILSVLQDLRAIPDVQVEALRHALANGRAAPVSANVVSQGLTSFEAKRPVGQLLVSGIQNTEASVEGSSASVAQRRASTTNGTSPLEQKDTPESNVVQPEQQGRQKGTKVSASFDLPFSVDEVWVFMSDLSAVAGCLPGAQIESETSEQVTGRIAIKFGPMAATFKGHATIARDAAHRVAVLKGTGQDSVSQSRATGDVRYQLEALSSSSTRVAVELVYTLQGPLAQFSRSGLVQEFVRRMVADFGQNVTQRLASPESAELFQAKAINPIGVMLSMLWQKIKTLFGPR
jgi:carbon-monoxide dehydrogenase small subunit